MWDLDAIRRMGGRKLWYLAHPVSGDEAANIKRAITWLRWLLEHDPTRVYIAPWVAEVQASLDTPGDPVPYERGMMDDKEVLDRCDGIVLTGPAPSPGMLQELAWAATAGKQAIDLTGFTHPAQFEEYVRGLPGSFASGWTQYLNAQVTT